MMSSLTRVTHTEVMADDDVRKFDAKRTVLARGLPLATSTAKVRASIAVARAISPQIPAEFPRTKRRLRAIGASTSPPSRDALESKEHR